MYCLFFILGCIMGSFYHVVATRLSNNLSIVTPQSHCINCKHILKWYELIPILSYIFLRGRCRECKSKIPPSCFIIEICTGVLFTVCYHVFKTPIDIAIGLVFVSALITIIVSDIEYMIILDEVLVFASILIIVLYLCSIGVYETCIRILYGILSFILMLGIKKIGDFIFKQESLGGGDIKLMFLVGLVLGFEMSICNIFLATFIAFPIALLLLITKKNNMIPFGPFLSMSAILLFIWGLDLMEVINFIF